MSTTFTTIITISFSAVSRYKITHPVINDQDYEMWNSYSIICWPTLVLINPSVSDRSFCHCGVVPFL